MDTRKPLQDFRSWRQISYNLAADLHLLIRIAREIEEAELVAEGRVLLERLEARSFSVAVVGEFKRGKSTFINALLGAEILPSDISPTTATINRVTFGLQPSVRLLFHNPDQPPVEISVEALAEHVTKLTADAEAVAARVREAVIQYPVRFCKNDIDIIDTPGLGDEDTMTAVTMRLLPQADAAIMVVMADSPFSETEGRFLEQLLAEEFSHILFVVTAMDRIRREQDRARVLDAIRDRISLRIQRWADANRTPDSPEHSALLSTYKEPRIYGLSALDALEARLDGDGEKLAQSGLVTFEEGLERFLTSSDRISLARRQQQTVEFAQKISAVIGGRQRDRNTRRTALRSSATHAVLIDTITLALEQAWQREERMLEATVQLAGSAIEQRYKIAFNNGLKKGLHAVQDRFSEMLPDQRDAFTFLAADSVLKYLREEVGEAFAELIQSLDVFSDDAVERAMVAARFTLAHVTGEPLLAAEPSPELAADIKEELAAVIPPTWDELLTQLRLPLIWDTLDQSQRRNAFDRFLSLDFGALPSKWLSLTERFVHQWASQQPPERPRQALQIWLTTLRRGQRTVLQRLLRQVEKERKGLSVRRDREDALLEHELRELERHQLTIEEIRSRAHQTRGHLQRS